MMIMTPDGARLNYRIWRGPGRHLVLLHGLASSLRIWDLTAPYLIPEFTVTAYDQRGHGESDKPEGSYALPVMLDDLAALLDRLSISKPVIVGHSWGATLALAYAAEYPSNCAGVALVDGGAVEFQALPGASWRKISEEFTPPDLSSVRLDDLVSLARGGDLKDLPAAFLRSFYASIMEERPGGTVRPRLRLDRHMEIFRATWETSLRSQLERVTAPLLLVMAGSPSDPGQARSTYEQAKRLGVALVEELRPEAKIAWLPDAAHDIPLQKPERLAAELLDFFE